MSLTEGFPKYEDTERAFEDIRLERNRQNLKWGEQNHSDTVWTAILAEEVGEAAQEALHIEFDANWDVEPRPDKLREELVQVAAVAVAWIEAIDRRST